jgi:double-stranded uracil-DNA glycosylase
MRGGALMPRRPSRGFAPIAAADAQLLILGSLPGQRSLELQQYYGQPRNAFWSIVGTLTGVAADASYAERVAGLIASRIAVWDVVAAARREGSLDSRIERNTVRANDFAAFFKRHAGVERICFNGATAKALYARHVIPRLPAHLTALPSAVLPSTSPAHAALSAAAKQQVWLRELSRRTPRLAAR